MTDSLIVVLGILFIFIMTCLGASLVFLFKKEIPPKLNSIILGFASGVMISASIWSLLLPAIEQTGAGFVNILPVVFGFVLGGALLVLLDFFNNKATKKESITKPRKMKSTTRLFLAVTLHNIPEGLAVGVAFGNALQLGTTGAVVSAFMLALGIGIQNFPEGMAVAIPLKEDCSNKKAFLYGVFSGVVEPLFACVGLLLSAFIPVIMPLLLAFSAGAMIFVVAEDLIPDAKIGESHLGAWGVMIGFVIMMLLDVLLG